MFVLLQVEKYAVVEKSLQLEDSQPSTVIWPAEVSGMGALMLFEDTDQ